MFLAHRAGSGTGGVGPESSPISHLSETMRALLDTSPVQAAQPAYFHIQNQEEGRLGAGGLGEARSRLGNAGVPCPLHTASPDFINFSSFWKLKTNKQY